jgi:proteasome lid subunit RPN8/RPN11
VSGDEMVFDEVRYREPARLRRPDRDSRRACVACGVPQPDDLPIFVDRGPADAIERHALSDTSVELGGILLGKECVDDQTGEPFVWITEALEAKHYENTQASFTYTHEAWEEITRERDRRFPDLDIVGWYHTHPDFGIFLSSHDLFIHQHFFAQPLQVAYVVDPIRGTRGFFRWREGQMAPVGGFWLTDTRAARVALARLAGDLEGQAPPSEGGGGLSPRVEAELMAMLTRQRTAPAAVGGTAGAAIGVLGALVGALAVAMLFGLAALYQELRGQGQALARMADSQQAAAGQVDAARASAKERALDAILADVRIGEPPEAIVGRYTEAVRQRDALRQRVEAAETEKEALTAHAGTLKRQAESLAGELAEAQAKAEQSSQLEAQVANLRTRLDAQGKGGTDDELATLERNFHVALWSAVGGWLAFALAGGFLIVLLGRRGREEAELSYPGAGGPTVRIPPAAQAEPPPHVIE